MKKVIIVGGGFAGLNLAKSLSRSDQFDVTVVDKNNYHFFPPLLYQVATAFVEPSNISYPFRKLFRSYKNVSFFMGDLTRVDPDKMEIETTNGRITYDYLVLAMGTEVNFFGNENIRAHALSMKTIDDALRIRNHILTRMEEAVRAESIEQKVRLANIVIAGGGPTGVEMAGMIAEMATTTVLKDYPDAGFTRGNIYLVDSGPFPLGPMSNVAQRKTYKVLSDLGVKIISQTQVKDFNGVDVLLSNGDCIPSATLIWCTGVIAKKVEGLNIEVFTRGNRIVVDEFSCIKGYNSIFAIGDIAYHCHDECFPNGHPQVAQVAIQQGKTLGQNLIRFSQGKMPVAFEYEDRGKMAIISKYSAVVDLKTGTVQGLVAWVLWLFIHLLPLVSFRNRLKVLFNWGLSFFTHDAGLRLIIRPERKHAVAEGRSIKNSTVVAVSDV